MRHLIPCIIVATALLTACNGGDEGTVKLTVSSLETGSTARSAVTTFTPTSFQMDITGVVLFGDGFEESLYEPPNDDLIEFQRDDGQPTLEANQPVPAGTYDELQIETGDRVITVAGCALLGQETHCTRTDPAQSSLTNVAESAEVRTANTIDAVLREPLEVSEGDTVELNLYYDLTEAITFLDEPGPDPGDMGFGRLGFGDDTSIEVKYPPMFAFIGPAPPVEIYEITLVTDPDPGVEPNLGAFYFPLDKWHVRMWAFFDDDGEPLARRDVWVAEEGADGAAMVSMFGNAAEMSANGDDTYTITEPNPDPDFQSWQMDAFERATHDGTATWTTPNGTKQIGYAAVRLQ